MTVIMDLPDYVVSPNPELWNITETGEAFVWTATNRTAALSVQVEAVCGPVLQNRGGLPSLTAVLFLIEAMTVPMNLLTAHRVEELFRPVDNLMPGDSKSQIIAWLVACGELDAELRKGPSRQGAMLNSLMENAPSSLFEIQSLQAIDAMHWLRLSLLDREVTYLRPQSVSQLKSALAIQTLVYFTKHPIGGASVRLRMRTGLDELPEEEVKTELPPAQQYSQLIKDLRDDEELGQFIQMASDAASTIALPRRPSDPDELQVGGVSDITNRGQPERLLATELAADPDLLMARIAHGQALYLRRESPPQHKALRRRVLIENGVRMWGLTRLRATAFALAVAACEERSRGPQLDVLTVAGSRSWSDDLSTRDGLVAQLARLEPDAHPGDAILELAESWDSDSEDFAEPLLIVSRNTHRDPDFRKCLNDLPRPFLLARIDQEGFVELLHCTRSGDDVFHKQCMDLPLKKLISAKKPSNDLPILLRQSPCPLRFSSDLSVRWASIGLGPTLWTLTHNRRLMCFDKAGIGAIEVTSLPGEIVSACPNAAGIALVVAEPIANTQQVRHLLVQASTLGDVRVHNLEVGDKDVRFVFREHLLRIRRELTVCDSETGKVLAVEPLGEKRHIGGHFFYCEAFVWAAVYQNDRIQWYELGKIQFYPGFAYYSFGEDGYPVVYSYNFAEAQRLDGQGTHAVRTGSSFNSTAVPKLLFFSDGHSAIVEVETEFHASIPSSTGHKTKVRKWLKLDRDNVSEVANNYATVLYGMDSRISKLVTTKSVRNRLQGIAIVDGSIVLIRNAWNSYAFEIADSPRRIVLRDFKSTSEISIVNFEREFKIDSSPFRHQWTLKKADLPRGEAWLDSRGLLHLRARDGSELSLVLHDNHISGWHSDGSVFGTPYFINRPETPVPASVEAWLREFANP